MVATKKLCWNCDGTVDAELSRCPYCAADLGSPVGELQEGSYHPPYQMVSEEEQVAPAPPYAHSQAHTLSSEPTAEEWEQSGQNERAQQEIERGEDDMKRVFLPLVMLLSGSVFLLFGFVMFFFSDNGMFILRWNARYSVFYLIAALPLLYFGWQALSQIDE